MTSGARQTRDEITHEELAHSFAAYLRLSFVYPAVNRRVIQSGDAVIAGFNQHRDSTNMLRLCLHRDGFRVNQHRVEMAEGDLVWLRDVFIKTTVAGVDLGPSLSVEMLSEFAARLQANFQRQDTTDFRLKWVGPFNGVQPLELHVDGEHLFPKLGDGDTTLHPSPGVWNLKRVVGGARSTVKQLNLDPDSPEVKLLVALDSSPELLEGLDRMRQRVNLEVLTEASLTGLDVLTQLVTTLPTEALNDPEYARSCVDKILGVVEMQMATLVSLGGEHMEADLVKLPLSVGRSIFPRGGAEDGSMSAGSRSERAGDETVQDDLGTLLTEYEALPKADDVSIEPKGDLKDEVLGILLNQMVTAKDDAAAKALVPALSELARQGGSVGELLGAYVDRCKVHGREGVDKKTLWRVADFAQTHGFAHSLGHDDLLETSTVVLAFPYLFSTFIDSLEDNDDDLNKIGDVCYGAGAERIRAARDVLLSEGGVAQGYRAGKILAKASRHVLPLAEILLEGAGQWITPLAVRFLKQMKLPDTASLALRVVRPSSVLPRNYLAGLCRAAFEDNFDRELVAQSTSIVCRFIRDTADDREQRERRLYAIHSLRDVYSQEVLTLLLELKHVCGPLSLSRELRSVRNAAIEVLDHHSRGTQG